VLDFTVEITISDFKTKNKRSPLGRILLMLKIHDTIYGIIAP